MTLRQSARPARRGSDRAGSTPAAPRSSAVADLLSLQRLAGNQAVAGLVRSAPVQRSTLDTEASAEERGQLQILTLDLISGPDADAIADATSTKAEPHLPVDQVIFGPEVPKAIRLALRHLAVDLLDKMSDNAVLNVPIDLSAHKGVNGVYRFARITPKGTPTAGKKKRLIVEIVRGTPPVDPKSVNVKDSSSRITKAGLKFGAGFGSDDERRPLLAALNRVSDTILAAAAGVTFVRSGEAKGPTGEPGHYEPTTRSITLYQTADQTSGASPDAGGSSFFAWAVTHELGHAIDYAKLAAAIAKRDEVARQLKAATDARKPQADLDKLKADLETAKTAVDAAHTGSDALKGGNLAQGDAFKILSSQPVSPYGAKGKGEDFAESFALFVTDPDLLKSIRPDKYAYFQERYSKAP